MELAMTSHDRRLSLEGAYNTRDIGGYQTIAGGVVQRGRFLRADGLHRLTAQDQDKITAYGIDTIIDLRHDQELAAKRNVFAGSERIAYYNLSLINPAHASLYEIRTLGDMYVHILDDCGAVLREVFARLAEARGGALFHCAAGKDRTGVVAALLLALAGVEPAQIVGDYAETERNLAPIMAELRADRPSVIPEEAYEQYLGSAPIHMEQMLAHLAQRYRDAQAYLYAIGLTMPQLETLQRKLLDA